MCFVDFLIKSSFKKKKELTRDASSFFIRFLKDMFLICCPEKAVKITYHNRNPWMNKSLKQDIAKREKLLKIKT